MFFYQIQLVDLLYIYSIVICCRKLEISLNVFIPNQIHIVHACIYTVLFQSLFTLNPCQHPIVILKDIKYIDLKVLVDFMYCGEVNVSQEQLPAILKVRK